MNSNRKQIIKALKEKLEEINGVAPFTSEFFSSNIYTKAVFWDEVKDFPSISLTPGPETREYLPAGFKWGYLEVNLKVYDKKEDVEESLENHLQSIEYIIDKNNRLEYKPGYFTEDIRILSILTDGGLLEPYGVGEIVLEIRYEIK